LLKQNIGKYLQSDKTLELHFKYDRAWETREQLEEALSTIEKELHTTASETIANKQSHIT
jgi:ribosome-binding factor A